MDLSSPQAVAAIVAGCVSLITAALTATITLLVTRRNIRGQIDLAEKRIMDDHALADKKEAAEARIAAAKIKSDTKISDDKIIAEYKHQLAAERLATQLMMSEKWSWRSYDTINHLLGGMDDKELRRILVGAGAIRAVTEQGEEVWGLLERHKDIETIEVINRHDSCMQLSKESLNRLEGLWPTAKT